MGIYFFVIFFIVLQKFSRKEAKKKKAQIFVPLPLGVFA
jgi:hypothetical protein